ncbi:usg protein [Croceicoccus naphthovorans]|uniref:Protein usg n=1 Tax=Croceicoccus naphthovorans TaxID=1348774 RepID=A0A0G3XFX8_9SPHN|nr:protein usg [Croceicoccus naphthovorans]AKM09293.1 protein usg [Croceicoccus naphthovorans]MBB3990194.1 uncharacterized protein Usg [Croceicoccus naphthovorans]
MADSDFQLQMQGYGLTTVMVHFWMPDHRSLLQQFLFQQYDVAPRYPRLSQFLDFWRTDIEAVLHSVSVAHNQLIGPTEWHAVDGVITIN